MAGLFILVGVAVVGGGLFLAHKVASNPGQFMAKAIESSNPNLEVLKADEGSGVLEVRDKSTGKVMRMNFEDAKHGKFVFSEDGKTSTLETNGEGGMHVRTSEGGSLDIGGAVKVPAWVPVYPGAQAQGGMTGASGEGEGGNATFLSNDAAAKVVSGYEAQLKGAGYTIESKSVMGDGHLLSARSGGKSVHVIIGKAGEQTSINVTYSSK